MTYVSPTEAFFCDECGDGVILWDGHREEVIPGYADFLTIVETHGIEMLPGGFCYSCHLKVN